jgi:hypothetical protein
VLFLTSVSPSLSVFKDLITDSSDFLAETPGSYLNEEAIVHIFSRSRCDLVGYDTLSFRKLLS